MLGPNLLFLAIWMVSICVKPINLNEIQASSKTSRKTLLAESRNLLLVLCVIMCYKAMIYKHKKIENNLQKLIKSFELLFELWGY